MANGRKKDPRSELAGKRFKLAVEIFTSSYSAIIKTTRWEKYVKFFEAREIRKWTEFGLPIKRIADVAAVFGLQSQAFTDEDISGQHFVDKLHEMKSKMITVGDKEIELEQIAVPQPSGPAGYGIPDEMGTSFESFIKDRLHGFCGREFVFDALDQFLDAPEQSSGYFLITGDPGIGKSALIAKLIKDRSNYLYHFNIALQAINKPHQFLNNLCSQLISRFELPYQQLPDGATADGSILNRLLSESADKLGEGEKIVIAVDALDEVDTTHVADGANLLFLPTALPDGVYVAATSRHLKDIPLTAANLQRFDLEFNSPDNRRDAALYIGSRTDQKMLAAIAAWDQTPDEFTAAMVDKSEGNFMYLRHVLPAVRNGEFKEGGLAQLPQGLLDYYRYHWRKMRLKDETRFDTLYRPVVCILATVKEAVSVDLIHNFTTINHFEIQNVIDKWFEFLHTETGEDPREKLYRVYHSTFQEYLYNEVEPGLKPYHRMISQYYLGLIGKGGP